MVAVIETLASSPCASGSLCSASDAAILTTTASAATRHMPAICTPAPHSHPSPPQVAITIHCRIHPGASQPFTRRIIFRSPVVMSPIIIAVLINCTVHARIGSGEKSRAGVFRCRRGTSQRRKCAVRGCPPPAAVLGDDDDESPGTARRYRYFPQDHRPAAARHLQLDVTPRL